ncbi:MAG: bifunctional riboflavin kinase/FAD synthetase [Ancalomicrobiaceae bacterium]|nr:bifunctional riboflavin kinase/FAD synthetase [Ancalomicrobiaceae bacterium]
MKAFHEMPGAAPRRTTPFQLIAGLAAVPAELRRPIVAIGNFDGVHRGHQAVLAAAEATADAGEAANRPRVALTFEPHPRSYFRPDRPLFRLTPMLPKARLIAAAGFDAMLVLPFDASLASMSAEDFVHEILVDRLEITGATVGWDFHFGHKRLGSPAFLAEAGQRHGFPVEIVREFDDEGGEPISSSRIRALLGAGELALANGLFGYRWFVTGRIVDGDKRGRTLGFPTANMKLSPDCQLGHGVYAVEFIVDGVIRQGVANYGRRPQFDNGAPVLETFVFDFSGDLYGKDVEVRFISYLRPELTFPSIEALVARMREDCDEARAVLSQLPLGSALDLALDDGRARLP